MSLLLQIVISFMFIKITIRFVLCICVFVRRLCIRCTPGCYKLSLGKDGHAKSDEFSEKFHRPSTPTPSFSENYVAFFYNGYGRIYARRYEGQTYLMFVIVFNSHIFISGLKILHSKVRKSATKQCK